MKVSSLFFISIFLFIALIPSSRAQIVIHPVIEDERGKLYLEILKLALSKSTPNVVFQEQKEARTEDRLIADLHSGRVSVLWTGIRPEVEKNLLPVHIPILKGMLGHRIFIIKKGNQHLFDNINNLENLKSLNAGQGTTWGDTAVLKNANLPTVTTLKYKNLFSMLEGDRFDYFPRAIHEPWSEVDSHQELNLIVEKRILLVYPFAMYFVVEPNNKSLHDQIYQGFESAIADGSFDKLFYSNFTIKDALYRTDIKNRIVLRIPNPNMSDKTPYDRKEFWLDLDKQ